MKHTPVMRPPSATLISTDQIQARLAEMGRMISEDYTDKSIMAVVVLKGACIFASDLVRQIDAHLPVEVEFVRACSYGDETHSSGHVRLDVPDRTQVAGKDVLLIEDIVDSGRTLSSLIDRISAMGPRSLESAALLFKDRQRDSRVDRTPPVRYVGFHVPDVFVVGYGLDYAQHYRHLPDIRALGPE